jgi:hypothetical protein
VTLEQQQNDLKEKLGIEYVPTKVAGIDVPTWVLRTGQTLPKSDRKNTPASGSLVESPSGVFGTQWIVRDQRDLAAADVPCGARS